MSIDKKALEKAMKDKLAKEGVNKEWMKDHLIIDMGGDDK
mgnify:FL=1|jgi:hypothetical protein|tara:strand:+ start:595 stop:714 length:120 start_codon:yes stop_codon:yes gene_type:complete